MLGIVFAPQLTKLITWGFSNEPGKLELTINLTRIMFPFMFFISLAALLTGVLNSLKQFFIPAVSPAFLSISEIACIFLVLPFLPGDAKIAALAYSVVAGGLGQFALQLLPLLKKGFSLKFDFSLKDEGQKRVFHLMLPAMVGLSVDQINSFVDTICASFLAQGSITALYYSNRIMQLPLALFGISLATVSLPSMSRSAASGNMDEMKNTINYSLRLIAIAVVPAAVGLIAIAEPVIQLLFERGRFDHLATQLTGGCLLYYSLGLPAFSGVKILANSFYALQDTVTPLKVAYVSMAVNVILNLVLMRYMGVAGLALATSISSWLNFLLLLFFLKKRAGLLGLKKNSPTFIKVSVAAAAAGIAAYFICGCFDNILLAVTTAISAAGLIYFALLYFMKLKELPEIFNIAGKENTAGNE